MKSAGENGSIINVGDVEKALSFLPIKGREERAL